MNAGDSSAAAATRRDARDPHTLPQGLGAIIAIIASPVTA